RVGLVAYDLPPGWQMVLDERKEVGNPPTTGEPRFFRRERVPVRAFDEDGSDETDAIRSADGQTAQPGLVDPRFVGLTTKRVLTLQFDKPLDVAGGVPLLVADGWIESPYAQPRFAGGQGRAVSRAPTTAARGADSAWPPFRREFGYPAGMPRRISVPLGPLPAGTISLRLTTTQEIYWD